MGAGQSQQQYRAENDRRYQNVVMNCAKNPLGQQPGKVVGVAVDYLTFTYCYKPIHGPYNLEYIPYPKNIEFRKRVPYSVWLQFNADLAIALYNHAWRCNWLYIFGPCGVIAQLICSGCQLVNELEVRVGLVIEHYNRHLFHPMLIDAQQFVTFKVMEEGGEMPVERYLGFIIADDPAEFHNIPKPQIGLSSGYRIGYHDDRLYSRSTAPSAFPERTVVPKPLFPEAPALVKQGPQRHLRGCDLCTTALCTRTVPSASADVAGQPVGPIESIPLKSGSGQGGVAVGLQTQHIARDVEMAPAGQPSAPAQPVSVSYALPGPDSSGPAYKPGQVVASAHAEV